MRQTGNDQEYTFPDWWRLESGDEYYNAGYIQVKGGVPEIEIVRYDYCSE